VDKEEILKKYENAPPISFVAFGLKLLDAKSQEKWTVPDRVLIKAAVTGALMDREDNPTQPYTVDEIIQDSIECVDAGATSIHVHVRDESGYPSADRALVAKVVTALRDRYGGKIHLDGEIANGSTFAQMVEPAIDDFLESGAVNTTASYLGEVGVVMPKETAVGTVELLQTMGKKPQVAVYNMGDIDNAYRWLIRPGILEEPFEWAIVPAMPGCAPMYDPVGMCETMIGFVRRIKDVDPAEHPFIWVASSGRASVFLCTLSILLGLHVRVGKEDALYRWPHKDDIVKSNREVVEETVALARLLGREPMGANEYRRLMGMKEM